MGAWLMVASLFVVAAVAGWLLWRLRQLQSLVATLEQDHRKLTEAWKMLPPDASALLPRGTAPLISIEILNPVELASKESRFAAPLGAVAPSVIRRLVYERTVLILQDELVKYGVQAEVRTHGMA
ncbi:hypothetical protein E4T66_06675 [Sinimarinibacterium sp. CAU 1509]|uniref:hypothetical protein n=1 Tax=Sinimarinibacterium sp. CAU 1509 TaxID=2562283 RepID=UPI0010AD4582|nr:hypothetical protein [Sinimarinibacterium sp. CAU 1509]TJY61925.1 hypothetical protein E4T66_06675 [Sinimarinibacterium sp. CAU 1509]